MRSLAYLLSLPSHPNSFTVLVPLFSDHTGNRQRYCKVGSQTVCSTHTCLPTPFARRGDAPFPRKEDGSLLYDDTDYKVTWAAMEKLVEKGLVRSIGLSNFNSRQIDDILSVASIKPTVLQVHDVASKAEERRTTS